MSPSKFVNRQSLYLRPDPSRVVVRPFKPATEPRDLNPTDKVRANHIVSRVLRLDAEASAQQLREVLQNFEGRHRNLLEIFETRAEEMEEALDPHDEKQIRQELKAAGFANVSFDGVDARSKAPSPRDPAVAYCQGTPLRNEIEARGAPGLEEATNKAAEAMARKFGTGAVDGRIRAFVISAS